MATRITRSSPIARSLASASKGSRFDLSGAFNYVRLENLPSNAIGPGGLGAGAFYFAAAGVRYSYQLYLSELTLRVKTRDNRLSAAIGRMHYASGGEHVSAFPSLETVKRERLHSRLVGDFEWSLYQRRFDGVRADLDRAAWRLTSSAFLPTQGGYEESTNLSMPKVQIAGVALTGKSSSPREWQAFGHLYRDRRASAAVVDNTFSADRPVDVTIAAIGGSHARVAATRAGELDTVVWVAGELGDWYGQPHRAASVAAEIGHRWTAAPDAAVASRRLPLRVRRQRSVRQPPRHVFPDAALVAEVRAVVGVCADEPQRSLRAGAG